LISETYADITANTTFEILVYLSAASRFGEIKT